ncbi:IgGFc-binding protein [Holothuria leucospilota]|uniref:IgGFc-binding protein n=1 Tax=Holothuria leucospilota TaxID=206669 RepID=A0A9Q1H2V2_HOLLE|nr:IgGFc-binding protein [Holothuria leucospilota]
MCMVIGCDSQTCFAKRYTEHMEILDALMSFVVLYLLAIANGQQLNSKMTNKCRVPPSRGRDFVIGFTSHLGNRVGELHIQVVAFSGNTTTVTISSRYQIKGTYYPTTFDIPPKGFRREEVPYYDFLLERSSYRSYKVLRVTASEDVAVYGIHLVPYNSDAFIALPYCQLGVHYIANSLRMDRKYASHSLLAVIGLEHDTSVQISLAAKVIFGGKRYYPNDVLTFVVDADEIVQILAGENGGDLSGSIIRSDNPIAAFSGNECALTQGSSCDIISYQLIPVDKWGTKHIFTATGEQNDVSLYKISAGFDNTIISVPGYEGRALQAGDLLKVELRGSGVIYSNLPSKVDQIIITISGSRVDPSIIQVPAEEQFDFVFGFTTLPKSRREGSGFTSFVNIVVKPGECNTVTTNGEYLQCSATAVPVPGTDYVVITKRLPKPEKLYIIQQNASQATHPISVIVYGYERYETYGFSAGFSLPSKVLPTMNLSVNNQVVENTIYVAEHTEVNITCFAVEARPATNLALEINGLQHSPVQSEVSQTFQDCYLDTFNTSSTVLYLAKHEQETVTCRGTLDSEEDEETAENVSLQLMTYNHPTLVLLINGHHSNLGALHVDEKEEVTLTCMALGARPAVNFEWKVNETPVDQNKILSGDYSLKKDSTNSISILKFIPRAENVIVTCSSKMDVANVERTVCGTLSTYVKPTLFLAANSHRVATYIYVTEKGPVNVTCNSLGARPRASLTWKFNGKVVNSGNFTIITSRGKHNRTNSSSVLQVRPESENDTLTCVSRLAKGNISQDVTGKFFFSVIPKLVLVINGYKNPKQVINVTKYDTINASCYALHGRPEVNLTWLMNNKRVDIHSEQIEVSLEIIKRENNTVDTVSKILFSSEIHYGNITCVMTSVTGMESTLEGNFMVIAKVSVTEEIHWDKFLKRVLDLPDSMSLTRTEGIVTTKGGLYLAHEHLLCESLDIRINEKQRTNSSDNFVLPVRDVVKYLLGIMEGMELLHSYGFLHPGFSTKKVLVTSAGVCKLYDFCLAEDAGRTVAVKKSETSSNSVNHFAPEALLRNEYYKESDVWSMGVVIWALLSGGKRNDVTKMKYMQLSSYP